MRKAGRVLAAVCLIIILSPPFAGSASIPKSSRGYTLYVVRRGDTLFTIARKYRLSWKTLARVNAIRPPYKIYRGQRLMVPLPKGRYRVYRVRRGDYLKRIAARYGVPWRVLARVNGIRSPYKIYRGQYLKIPRAGARSRRPSPSSYSRKGRALKIGFLSPVPGRGKGGINMGLDFSLSQGEEILSSAPGRVVYASLDMRGLGSVLIIEHPGGYETVYTGKAIYWTVGEGEEVGKSKVLGEAVEDTVLHFEIRRAGRPLPAGKLVGRMKKRGKR